MGNRDAIQTGYALKFQRGSPKALANGISFRGSSGHMPTYNANCTNRLCGEPSLSILTSDSIKFPVRIVVPSLSILILFGPHGAPRWAEQSHARVDFYFYTLLFDFNPLHHSLFLSIVYLYSVLPSASFGSSPLRTTPREADIPLEPKSRNSMDLSYGGKHH